MPRRKTKDEVILDFKNAHGERYDYSDTKIGLSREKCNIRCYEHGEFMVTPKNHNAGHGCPNCGKSSFKKNLPATLYVLKILMLDGRVSYKIGITNRSVKHRYSGVELQNVLNYSEYYYWNGEDAENVERNVKRRFSNYTCRKENYPLKSGYTECFDTDFDISIYLKSLEH